MRISQIQVKVKLINCYENEMLPGIKINYCYTQHDESCKHEVESKKLDSQEYVLSDFIYIKFKVSKTILWCQKSEYLRKKKTDTDWDKTFADNESNKGSVSRTNKELSKLGSKKTNTPIKNG